MAEAFREQRGALSDLVIPDTWELLAGGDTGTFMSCVFVAVSADPYEALALAEFPNYRYVGGEFELLDLSIGEWAFGVLDCWHRLTSRSCKPWVDANSQFVTELSHHDIDCQRNRKGAELRVEITREYFQNDKIKLAPWLTVLPEELEEARWPPDVSSSTGRYMRLKEKDHTLDCLEHALSRRPRSKRLRKDQQQTFLDKYLARHKRLDRNAGIDRHLGRNA